MQGKKLMDMVLQHSSQFQKWEIDSISNARYDVENISWEKEGIVITLFPDEIKKTDFDHKIQIIWDSSLVVSYHVTDETYRADCWGIDFQNNGRFYAARESEYIGSLRNRSPLFPDEVIHFSIIGTNTVVDLLAKDYPKIRTIE